ncbi:hypothetical protein AJ80_03846 [Polytolypa hystricis UAMH7299]|uniref:Regulator of volume decrease after cellular swelling-domain-containing protein n=1 Tax=Polytolypa hystricis (strain UAMH7299) TaxID=1447883 RepID=A0A2B7YF62_POLH7|nr:hypothetical protein AJ80_03846 [Polytolypa hystricis UAMH7299]
MEVLHTPPNPSSFVPLTESTPTTTTAPVLHYRSEKCKIVISEQDLRESTALRALRPAAPAGHAANGTTASTTAGGEAEMEEEGKEIVLDQVDVWVTSERLLLYSSSASAGVAIPYPSISLHAIQRLQLPGEESAAANGVQGLYMQLANPNQDPEEADLDMDEESICLTIVPPSPHPAEEAEAQAQPAEGEEEEKPAQTPTQDLFAALSACSNLHPDPTAAQDGEAEANDNNNPTTSAGGLGDSLLYQNGLIIPGNNTGGLPPALPGSGGWITAENMHEYFDEEGNWKGEGEGEGGSLGPGAGSVREREEEGEGETKWRMTE